MSLTLFGINGYPHDFLVTKANVSLEQCVFLLDFTRPLEKVRRFGLTVGLLVPVAHISEKTGGYVIAVHRSDPYFRDIPKLWAAHQGHASGKTIVPTENLKLVADFATHFREDLPNES